MARSKSKCRCKSRTGHQKKRFTSRNHAHKTAVRTGRGHARIYRCPASKGVWHITQKENP